MLGKRLNLEIDDIYMKESNAPDLCWNADSSYLDCFCCTSNEIGLDAFIPNTMLHNYDFHLLLNQPYRQFHAKHTKLGFDPIHSMLWLGRSGGHEDVWLAMAPATYLDHEDDVPAGTVSGITGLKAKHYRMVVMMMTYFLKLARIPGIVVREQYPDLDRNDCIRSATNIL